MFKRVGFFHFGTRYGFPIEALESELQEENFHPKGDDSAESLPDVLIVLPEAFNIRKSYRSEGTSDTKAAIKDDLQRICRTYGVAFVAGLLVEERGGPIPPYSTAYLVDSRQSIPIYQKEENDGLDSCTPYTCFKGDNADNPTLYNESIVASLVCMDGNIYANCQDRDLTQRIRERRKALTDRIALIPIDSIKTKLLCVPANEAYSLEAANGWPDDYIAVLANSLPSGPGSVIRTAGSVRKEYGVVDNEKTVNKICTFEINGKPVSSG